MVCFVGLGLAGGLGAGRENLDGSAGPHPLQPFDETSVKSRSKQLKFALEMNQGWFAAHGVRSGAKLDLAAVAAALKARGAEARDYGLGE